jgi:hypothetical protein
MATEALGTPYRLGSFPVRVEGGYAMKSALAAEIHRLLHERVGIEIRAALIARAVVKPALEGDAGMCKLILDLEATYDPTAQSAWDDSDESQD